ncbi:TAR DNA-binding protein 43, partial [Bienertia sinuspersici]
EDDFRPFSRVPHGGHGGGCGHGGIPKDQEGFGFVTFAGDGVADLVARRSDEILGQPVAIDSATPVDDAGPIGGLLMDNPEPPYGGYGPMRGGYGRMYSDLDFDDWGGSYGFSSSRPSRAD